MMTWERWSTTLSVDSRNLATGLSQLHFRYCDDPDGHCAPAKRGRDFTGFFSRKWSCGCHNESNRPDPQPAWTPGGISRQRGLERQRCIGRSKSEMRLRRRQTHYRQRRKHRCDRSQRASLPERSKSNAASSISTQSPEKEIEFLEAAGV